MADRADYDSDVRVLEWEVGLPSASDLTPLTQPLVPPELASAFSVKPEPVRTNLDVQRASQETLTSIRRHGSSSNSSPQFPQFDDSMAAEGEDPSDSRVRESSGGEDPDARARALKRPRLVWTPRLHKRFVEVVAHLGIRNAVPKTIMQLMNVEGLTRENVASHLQKYRLYLKRIQGLSNEGPSPSDPLFASIPVPQNLQEYNDSTSNNNNQMPAQQQQQQQQLVQPVVAAMPYAVPTMIPMPMYGVPLLPPGSHHNGAIGMVPVNNGHYEAYNQYGHYEAYHQYGNHGGVQYQFGGYGENQVNDWGNGSKFGSSVVSYPPPNVTPSDK